MTYDIKIDPDFRDLLNPLSEEEYNALEASILKDGVEDPLKVWNGILVDGHNRLEICKKHGITEYPVKEKHFDSKSDAMEWIIDNQKGRRNLTLSQLVKCYEKVREQVAKEAKERQLSNLKQNADGSNLTPRTDNKKTAEKIAEKIGVSKNTYKAAREVVAHGTPEEIARLDKGGKGNGAQRIAMQVKARTEGITEKLCPLCNRTLPIEKFSGNGYCAECDSKRAMRSKQSVKADAEVAKKLKLDQFVVPADDNEVREVSMDRIEREVMWAVEMFLESVRQTASDDFDHGDKWKEIIVKAQQRVVAGLAEM